MKIENAAPFMAAGSGLKDVNVNGNSVVVELKNGSTLTITAAVVEGEFSHYEMEMLTGKENKMIQKKLEKIEELTKEIEMMKSGNATFEDSDPELEPLEELEVEPSEENDENVEETEEISENN